MKRVHYYSHRGRRKHPTSLIHRLTSGILVPVLLVVALGAFAGARFAPQAYTMEAGTLFVALGASLLRLIGAYLVALVIGVPLGLLAVANKRAESFLLPVYDVLESLPVLAFFPIIILFFLRSNLLEGAAIFIIFFSMIWNIAFSTIGGLKVVPEDVRMIGKAFGLSPWQRFRHVTLPALFPPLVTGSILALADGWNIVIVAEALHAYAPATATAPDLFGIGSILVGASTSGNTPLLLGAMAMLVVAIALINILVWQPLLARASRYAFE